MKRGFGRIQYPTRITGYDKKPFFSMMPNFPKNSTMIKSWVSFEKFRKFSLWWALKFSNLDQSELKKTRFEVAYPLKNHHHSQGVLKNIGNSLYDGHWNFPILIKESRENGDKRFQLVFWNHDQNQLLWTECHTKN